MCISIISFLLHFSLCSINYASVHDYSSKMHFKYYSKDILDPGICVQEATCEPIHNKTCFGTSLPYFYTSVALAEDSISQFEVQDNLALWEGLRSVPRCWAVVQPLLCAVYMPKCENGTVFLPSQEMCRITRKPCKSVELKHFWPPFLRCENKKLFPPLCRNPLQEVKFNTSSKCLPPLVETDIAENWFYEVEGCGLQCQDPLFTKDEHEKMHKFIAIMAATCFAANIFLVATYFINWKTVNHYPNVIIFYINLCLAIALFGWFIQFFPGAREEIACLHDGTMRKNRQWSGEHLLCTITFILIYGFMMAAIIWFIIWAYAWYILIHPSGTPKDIFKKKVPYFHLASWCIPIVLSTIIMALKEIDGDFMSGICFVGYANYKMRILFVLIPVGAAVLIGGFFLICDLYILKVKFKTREVANLYEKKRINKVIFKIGIFSTFSLIFIIFTFAYHAYDFVYRKEWEESLLDLIICLAMNTNSGATKCSLKSKPNLFFLQLHIFSLFGFGILMSFWVWSKATLESWRQFLNGKCSPAEKNAIALKRHQLIAKAFQRRHEINQGHFSLSLNSTHEDPVGMNLDVNSVASRDISSSWAAALPQFLMRRNAVTNLGRFVPRHYSSVSDVSRHISLDSFNQQNLDSLSLQISEQEYVAHALRHQRRKTRKERERFLRANRIAPWFPGSRRGSDTSLQSSILAASLAAAAAKNVSKVTKATSTGDLSTFEVLGAFHHPQTHRTFPRHQIIHPPFTHGMTDNSHRIGEASNIRMTPHPISTTLQNPLNSLQSFYNPNYDLMHINYFGGYAYASPATPLFPNYIPPNNMSYIPYQAPDSVICPYQPNLLPLHPRIDSASETEYLPIIMSDSEFTDAGHRSYDESQLFSAHSLSNNLSKPILEPQACHKAQILENMAIIQAKQTQRPLSGRKSPHSEVPPPSPAGSSKSDDEVFIPFQNSLQQEEEETLFQKIKSKLTRSTSSNQKTESHKMTSRPCHSSLGQLSQSKNRAEESEKADLPEKVALLPQQENISR